MLVFTMLRVRAISTDIIRLTIVQHCCTSDLELTATCSVKLRLSLSLSLSLSTFKSRLKLACFILLSVNCSTYLFRQRRCSRLTALQRVMYCYCCL